jgi:hypothetical protein
MGELFPIILVAAMVLIVVATLMAKASIHGKQVVRPLEQEEIVIRIKISLDSVRAQMLGQKLADAGCESWDKREIVDVDFNDSDDRIIRFTIVPKELNLTATSDKKSEKEDKNGNRA